MNEPTSLYSLEVRYEIWNDRTGSRIDVGPDRDGLDLIEIRAVSDDGKVGQSITLTKEQAALVAQALNLVCS